MTTEQPANEDTNAVKQLLLQVSTFAAGLICKLVVAVKQDGDWSCREQISCIICMRPTPKLE
jgi:hypothetical protein